MTLAEAGARTRRSRPRSVVARALVVTVALAAVLAAAHGLGYRLNVQTGSVPVPAATTSPEDVVRAYTEAYDRRDFATMTTIYPSKQGAFSRFRAMGTMHDLAITQSREALESDLAGTFPKAGHSYYRVEATYRYTGLTGSEVNREDGPGGTTYWLERSSDAEPWTIVDDGF